VFVGKTNANGVAAQGSAHIQSLRCTLPLALAELISHASSAAAAAKKKNASENKWCGSSEESIQRARNARLRVAKRVLLVIVWAGSSTQESRRCKFFCVHYAIFALGVRRATTEKGCARCQTALFRESEKRRRLCALQPPRAARNFPRGALSNTNFSKLKMSTAKFRFENSKSPT
jgi:hypothetical protein